MKDPVQVFGRLLLTRGHGQQVELLLRRVGGSLPVSRTPLHWISEDPTRSAPDSIEPLEYPERGE
jgi:hypothetical protein